MNKQVVVIGASGHGKVFADIALASGDCVLGFLDDDSGMERCLGLPVLGRIKDYVRYLEAEFIVAIGNAAVRERIAGELHGVKWYTAIHPCAVISPLETGVGEGTVVMANAVINPGAVVGRHCIINTAAVVEHDCRIGDLAHISVGAKLAGAVRVGKRTWVGIGAVVSNNLSVCPDCTIGAGAVVVKNLTESGTYVGVPAKRMNGV